VTFLHVTGSETEALVMGDEVAVLSAGRVEQSAPADILFRKPATAATARHLNAYNILAGAADGEAVTSVAGSIHVPGASGLSRGHSVELALRFDRIDVLAVTDAVPAGRATLTARFLTAEFNGASVLSFFRLVDGTMFQVVDHLSAPRNGVLVEGSDYQLTFDPADIILYSERAA
jgi:putative spermidine/putrescine transport system ATP-binding protein